MLQSKRSLILTVDYEIFGNGTGDVRDHITRPTSRMAAVCEKHGVPLTVFFEVEEYLAFVRERRQLIASLGYDPAEDIRSQILALARKGHDIQLHLHPEWVGATFRDGEWNLRAEKRTVDSLFATAEETSAYIGERKAVIDALLREAGCSDPVTAYRAGAFCAQPGQKLLSALTQNGFVVDSSLVKGMRRQDSHVTFDFTDAPIHRRHWLVRDDVAREDRTGRIVEVPIYSRMGRRYHQLTPKRLLAKFSRNVPKAKRREMVEQLGVGRSPTSLARFLWQEFPTKLDFHNMSARQMLRWIRQTPKAPAGDLDALVLIGHTKEHRSDPDLDRFLSGVRDHTDWEIISMTELARRLVKHQQMQAVSAA